MKSEEKVMLSGVKPTGRPHIGNFFGAMKQFVDLQNKYEESYIFIADLHALTSVQDGEKLQEATLNLAIDYLAIGLDPEKVTLYKQSDVPQVTELTWIFNCLVTMPYLMRAHAFKDAEAKSKDINVGIFDYPILMAADILLPDSDVVPVGKDQKQHVEIARETARKFNQTFGETFKEPKEIILEAVETVPGIDGQKMSKSYNNTIELFASDEEIEKVVMSIVTDSGAGIPENVYAIHKLFRSEEELKKLYSENEGQYKALKEALIEDLKAFISPMREKREELASNPKEVMEILHKNGEKMREVFEKKMMDVRKKAGLLMDL